MWDIRDGRANGMWVPILQHLARRDEPELMVQLADWYSGKDGTYLGVASDPFSPAGLYRRAYRKGAARGAFNMALSFFNRNDLSRYRYWLLRAARAGDKDAASQARRFETRLPHAAAKPIGRHRPAAKRDIFA